MKAGPENTGRNPGKGGYRTWKNLLWRKHLISIMTLSGAPPPPLGYPPVAIVPYYRYTII
jgi:hypothetical protein